MTLRIGLLVVLGLLVVVGPAAAQTEPWRPSPPAGQPVAQPDQPVVPQLPTLERRQGPLQPPAPAPVQPHPVPFTLSPAEEAQLDRVLQDWEQSSARVKTFDCSFTRFEYDPVFGPPDKPRFIDKGQLKFAAPDKGMFRVDGQRPEHWICDGKAIYEYNFTKKELIEHKLPSELQGKAIADGPLPFLFGASAAKLKQRYFLRIITPADALQNQIWLEAYPRFQQDAVNFRRAELILNANDKLPFALQMHLPNGQNRTVYQFVNILTNDLLGFLKGDPFVAPTPLGWKRTVEEVPSAQQARVGPAEAGRR